MKENVIKIFDMLGVKPYEKFKITGYDDIYYINEDLRLINAITNTYYPNTFRKLLNNTYEIIKLPKKNKNCDSNICGICYLQVDTIVFNGRVESANELGLSLTSIDLKIIINNYDFDYFEKYNLSKSRVLYYPWGVFCTAYARKILWEIITKIDKISHNDYIYLDTDSIKLMNSYKYEKIKSKIQEKKLRDLNPEEWAKWKNKNCDSNICGKCIFNNVACYSWVNHKDLYSDKFLDQE